MNIVHLGASGNVGSRILEEALRRRHTVTAIVRNPDRMRPQEGLTALAGDVGDPEEVAPLMVGHDLAIVSIKFSEIDADAILEAMRHAGVPRLMVVGGAGSLKGPDGVEILDSPGFPEAYKPEATAAREFLNQLYQVNDLDWTYVSPSAELVPGKGTGKFRLGKDDLLVSSEGRSWISRDDFAIAFIQELELHNHPKQRITVGY